MAIDTLTEELHTLEGIRRFLPATPRTGKPPHPSAIFRWTQKGIKAGDGTVVILEAVKAGGRLCTSREALARFWDELTKRRTGQGAEPRRPKAGRHERTSRRLAAVGLK